MEIFWIVVTVLVVLAVIGAWYLLVVRGGFISRAEHTDPEQAKALREVQRQIDIGSTYSARDGMDRNF
jgi:hypothetical protein